MSNPYNAKEMIEAINSCLSADLLKLSEWEEQFFIDIEEKVNNGASLSVKQLAKLESIYDRT